MVCMHHPVCNALNYISLMLRFWFKSLRTTAFRPSCLTLKNGGRRRWNKVLESKYPNISGLSATFHKNNHFLPVIRIYLVNYKKSCWKPLQILKAFGVQHSVTLRNQCGQPDASKDCHHSIALHPESLHLRRDKQGDWSAINLVLSYLTNILLIPSCLCLLSFRSCLLTSPIQLHVTLVFNFQTFLPPSLTCEAPFWDPHILFGTMDLALNSCNM